MPGLDPPTLRRVLPARDRWPLFDVAASRRIEAGAAGAHPSLMERAGLACARLAVAAWPHARRIWVAAGPGNNGGDGLEAAMHLHRAGRDVHVSLLADASHLPSDAAAALSRAQEAGVTIEARLPEASRHELALDALLGLGASRAPEGAIARAIAQLNAAGPVLAVDLPSGLHAATGQALGDDAVRATRTLALLTLKPGLFTGHGRDHAGEIWCDTLSVSPSEAPTAWLGPSSLPQHRRAHASHKGTFGDVIVVGGAPGMTGAALLASRAALVLGGGRVFACLLDAGGPAVDPGCPELMLRPPLWATQPATLKSSTVVAGCGAGTAIIASLLPAMLHHAERLVLDADALNAIAGDEGLRALLAARERPTVLTPHPLEAARLLDTTAATVQTDRLSAAARLADRFGCAVLLKGSGSVIAAPGETPAINPSGNALLATAGTGDVLAGAIGASWSQNRELPAHDVAASAAWLHGTAADAAMARGESAPLSASRLIEAMRALVSSAPAGAE